MWYVFPQIAGLGFSPTSRRYAIRSRDEAAAYLKNELTKWGRVIKERGMRAE